MLGESRQNKKAILFVRKPDLPGCQKTVLLAVLLLGISVANAQEPNALPDLGDPTAAVLSLSQEQRLGKIFAMRLRAALPIIQDIETNEYISALGYELTNALTDTPLPFYFLLVRNSGVNAFATVGGVIAINSGLFLETQKESQLAAVLAHEIGHVTNRHIARSLSVQKDLSWVNTLTLLSAIIASVYDPELGKVGLQALALPFEKRLAYSRHFEFEADRVGMQLLASARIDPAGMAEFFSLLNALNQGGNTPEFLRTHPLTIDRITSASDFARQPHKNHRDNSPAFQFAQARLFASLDPTAAVKVSGNSRLAIYQRAVALNALLKPQEAIKTLAAIDDARDHLPIRLALAQAQILAGAYAEAEAGLQKLDALYPRRETVRHYLALAQMHQNKLTKAFLALKPFENSFRYPILIKQLAQIASKQNKPGLSYEYLADYYLHSGYIDAALENITRAEKLLAKERIAALRIKAKRQRIEQLKKEIEKPLL